MSVIKKKPLCRSYAQYHKTKGELIKQKPLSLEELRAREDLWVWVVPIGGANFEPKWFYNYGWELRDRNYMAYEGLSNPVGYGKTWLAYARKWGKEGK